MDDSRFTSKGHLLNLEICYMVDHMDEYSESDIVNLCSFIINSIKHEDFKLNLRKRGFKEEFINKFFELAKKE
jgi:hypothetical protein